MAWHDLEPVLPCILSFLDALSLALYRGACRSAQALLNDHVVEIARARGVSVGDAPTSRRLRELRRFEAAVVFETFQAETRGNWLAGPTLAGDAARDTPGDEPRPWRYDQCGVVPGEGLVLRGGGEMNFTGLHASFGQEPKRPNYVSFEYKVTQRCRRRGFLNVFFSHGAVPHRALRYYAAGHPDVFSVLVPLQESPVSQGKHPQLWIPGFQGVFDLGPAVDPAELFSPHPPPGPRGDWSHIELFMEWRQKGDTLKTARGSHAAAAPTLLLGVRYGGRLNVLELPLSRKYQGFRHVSLFNWVGDEDSRSDAAPESRVRNFVIEKQFVQGLVPEHYAEFRNCFFNGMHLSIRRNDMTFFQAEADLDFDEDEPQAPDHAYDHAADTHDELLAAGDPDRIFDWVGDSDDDVADAEEGADAEEDDAEEDAALAHLEQTLALAAEHVARLRDS
ncbi:hypothetical protein M885DRAFT_512184 [Pelagophyceae sp. CCMP2097]|nr:hypothetical protein M885DRAFT_512184 [Pelagophyceae sp. CCMP2097]